MSKAFAAFKAYGDATANRRIAALNLAGCLRELDDAKEEYDKAGMAHSKAIDAEVAAAEALKPYIKD
jgi:hypothetical protein